jgi:hypothetical protein
MKQDCFVFDIDGTLADHEGVRSPFDESKVYYDKPIDPVWKVLRALRLANYKIIFLSGRTEKCRTDTLMWLTEHLGEGEYTRFVDLLMRKVGDNRNDAIVKQEIYDAIVLPYYNVIGVFDDRMRVCRMLYDKGLFVFNVNQGLKEF